jgi:hypothetical protein
MSNVNYKLGTSLSLLVTVDTTTGWVFTGSTVYFDVFDYRQINATTRGTPLFTKSWAVHQSATETLLTLTPTELSLLPNKYIGSLRVEHSTANKVTQDFPFTVVNFELANCGNSCNVVIKNVDCNLVFKIQGAIINNNSPGGTTNRVFGEGLNGLINGSNATFTTPDNFVQGSEEVKINGLTQRPTRDYTITPPNTIQFTSSPEPNDQLFISYNKLI